MRTRLILSFGVVVLTAVVGVVLIARQGAATEVRMFMQRGGMVRLENLADELETYYRDQGSWEGAQNLLESYLTAPGGGGGVGRPEHAGQGMMGSMMNDHLLLADPGGTVVADTSGARIGVQMTAVERQTALPLKSGLRTVGYLVPVGGMDFSPGDESFLVERLTRAAVIGGLIAGGVALLLALYLSSRLSRPVRLLTAAAQRLSSGDLSQRVAIQGGDELAELGGTFNHMAGSLQSAQESRRAMTADIAHELRNPLAVQRAHLEALQDGIYPLTGENLGPVLAQNVLLTRLVEDLRTLALADAGQLELNFSEVNLPDLGSRVVARYRPQADSRQVAIAFETGPDCPALRADPERIEQVLGNLLSNALRFVPEGGKIDLILTCEPAHISLTVRDDGPGIPTAALPRLFERFYRADRGRSREDGGSGLGLAIARQIVELHGGSISAYNHPQGGAVFQINLPLEPVDGQE